MTNKQAKWDQLAKSISKCKKCLQLKNKNDVDCSLINIYQDMTFAKNIPSIWTDWYHRLDAEIMIIGQDWGPYIEMQKLNQLYQQEKNEKNWYKLMDQEKSLTKKNLEKFLISSAKSNGINLTKKDISNIYITNAIMCARSGNNYRGTNIKLKESTINCMEFLKTQIDIVSPKIIVTLGLYPILALSKIYDFKIEETLTKTIEKNNYYKVQNKIIIPIYHPAAQISTSSQLKQYEKIWQLYKEN